MHCLRALGLTLVLSACAAPAPGIPPARGALVPVAPTTEARVDPLGLDVVRPRLAWQLRALDPQARGLRASGWHVLVASRPERLARDEGDLWDSGEVTATGLAVEYAGRALASAELAWWKVRVRDQDGGWSGWSPVARFGLGPLAPEDWGGAWIGAPGAERCWHLGGARWIAAGEGRAVLRRSFRIDAAREVVAGDLLVSSAGPLEVHLDGVRLRELPGGPQPVQLDLSPHLTPGAHALTFRGADPCLARLRVFFREGTELRLATDAAWRAGTAEPGWAEPDLDDAHWPLVELAASPGAAHDEALRDSGPLPDPWLRRTFALEEDVVRATAWVASVGYHELWANGAKVGEAVLAPGLSDLGRRARWVAYDLTPHLASGPNALGFWASAGWARFERFAPACAPFAPLVRARIDVELASGRTVRLATDASWRVRASPSTHLGGWGFADFGGERWDARRADERWCTAVVDDARWEPVVEHEVSLELSARRGEPDRRIEALVPVAVERLGSEHVRLDLGRNVTGFLEAELRGAPGATVTLTWSEREGQETTYAQRSECVFDASGRARFEHRFDYAVGRWITLRGPLEPPAPEDVRVWLVRSGFARTAELACADPLLQRIHDTIAWTFECLSQGGVVADCAHRERLGYGGDAHATLPTGLTHFGLLPFYRDWLEDWRDVQGADGGLPYTAPTYGGGGGPAWSGIVAYLPWELYVATGDRRVLAEGYATARRWLEFVATHVRDGLLEPYGDPTWGFLGDWVPPGRGQGPDERVDARSTLFFNNAYLVLCLERMAQAADVLAHAGDAREWRRRASALRATLQARFFDAERASYANGEQPYLALALLARLPPDELRPAVLARLEHEILVTSAGHVNAGIHGTAFLLQALQAEERPDLVLAMARQTTYPGWGHMLAEGATTIWEQWDGVHSRMHSSFLSLGAWFVQGLVGIRPDPGRPGYEHVLVRPAPAGDLAWARARLATVRGPLAVEWRQEEGLFTLELELPPGCEATVLVPCSDPLLVREGDGPARAARGVRALGMRDGAAAFEVGAGRYAFRAPR
ncbi:MAG TPA: alpha-L-rhamnosidase N-terminal domain-containing protein [Planctomycetota bacterium]